MRAYSQQGQRKAAFTFDRVFAPDCTQEEVYQYAAKPIVEGTFWGGGILWGGERARHAQLLSSYHTDVLRGYNGTLFAYGQTSSGKTHTMEVGACHAGWGRVDHSHSHHQTMRLPSLHQGPDPDGPDRGLIPRIIYSIFGYIEIAPDSYEFTVRVGTFVWLDGRALAPAPPHSAPSTLGRSRTLRSIWRRSATSSVVCAVSGWGVW